MPWILRFAIGSFFVSVIGAVMIAWACMSTGWETLSWFAWGSLTAGAGLIATALLAMLSAVIHQGWRRFSIALMCASVFLFLVLLIFAKFA
jgi:ABC-type multidrug transport system permease subunit